MIKRGNIVGAYEAKTHFSEILARVVEGEHVTITRHGVPVARLVPVNRTSTPQERRAAIETMRRLARQNRLGRLKIRDLMNEGRR